MYNINVSNIIKFLKRLWLSICRLFRKKQKHYHESFESDLSAKNVLDITPQDIEKYSRNGAYVLRNPKTGTVILAVYSIEALKTNYPLYEVVEPTSR